MRDARAYAPLGIFVEAGNRFFSSSPLPKEIEDLASNWLRENTATPGKIVKNQAAILPVSE
ncbi:MAG: hypothetical protein WAN04_14900 [Candidatus Udaeobacter sp.]